MSLLNRLTSESLDVSYAQAAARRGRGGPPPARRAGRAVLGVTVVAIGLLLGVAAANVRAHLPAAERERAQLAQRVAQRSAAVDALTAQVETARRQVASARARALAFSAEGRQVSRRLARLELVAGATPVSGPGLRIQLADAPGASAGGSRLGDPRARVDVEGRVSDRDLQQIVNGLWAAHAEAVAVDGVRLSARTSIRSAGDAILVDFRPVIPPYVVEAIGDPATLSARFTASSGGAYLAALQANWGIRGSIVTVDRLSLPPAAPLEVHLARPVTR